MQLSQSVTLTNTTIQPIFQCLTMDMGGSASTSDFVQAVIANIY